MKNLDQIKGCLFGGAAGDALGYPVEFWGREEIIDRFGEGGIREYALNGGVARISDDTQMTLFTANGLLLAAEEGEKNYGEWIYRAYLDWLYTQGRGARQGICWLAEVPALCSTRAPGITCLTALESGSAGTLENPVNDSKGCGGVMRVAPVALYFAGRGVAREFVDRLGAEAAAITHGHELGYLPATALVHTLSEILNGNPDLENCVRAGVTAVRNLFPRARYLSYFTELTERAIALSRADTGDVAVIDMLGEGWVGEETFAVAVYCALKYRSDFSRALAASVNHGGDSDSTGAVTGNLLGAYLGFRNIPDRFIKGLELAEVIEEIAEDLAEDFPADGERRQYKYTKRI